MKTLVLLIFAAMFLFSCTEIKIEKISIRHSRIEKCHKENAFSENRIQSSLEGDWSWDYGYNPWAPELANGSDFEGYVLRFNKERTLQLFDNNGNEEYFTNYRIEYIRDYYELKVDESSQFIWGRLLICDNELLFWDSHIDGSDNFYCKID